MSVQIYVDDNEDLYVLWSAHGAFQHLRSDGQHTEDYELPVVADKIYPLPESSYSELEDEYERGYERGYDQGYESGQEQGYESGLDAGREW